MLKNEETPVSKIDFIKSSKYTVWISLFFLLVSLGLLFNRGFSWGVDFVGGNQVRVVFDNSSNLTRDSLEKLLEELGINPSITAIANPDKKEFFIYYASQTKEQIQDIRAMFQKSYPDQWTILSENFVGSKVGEQFRKIAITSTFITLILILLYIALRFDFRFGVAAVVSLIHDIVLVLCFISFINLTFSIPILAAILTVVGYSLNDTIVIFDRMRTENKLLDKNPSISEYYSLVNRSVNKSLTRTFLTAGTTLIVLLILYFIGGAELKPMALVLILGVFIGTISSNLIAPPFLYLWHKKDINQSKKN